VGCRADARRFAAAQAREIALAMMRKILRAAGLSPNAQTPPAPTRSGGAVLESAAAGAVQHPFTPGGVCCGQVVGGAHGKGRTPTWIGSGLV
jgi:hypothetical protein